MSGKKSVKSGSSKDVIVINKRKVEDFAFSAIFVGFLCIFFYMVFMGIGTVVDLGVESLDSDLMTWYYDDTINVAYVIPSDTWQTMKFDESVESERATILSDSKVDGEFNFYTDAFSSEYVSCLGLNIEGEVGFRQFMSYSFRATEGQDDFMTYSDTSFRRDMTYTSDGSVSDVATIASIELLSSEETANGGILSKYYVVHIVDSGVEGIYYTQYMQVYGANMVTIIYGSIMSDETVDGYIEYFGDSVYQLSVLTETSDEVVLDGVVSGAVEEGVDGSAVVEDDTGLKYTEVEDGNDTLGSVEVETEDVELEDVELEDVEVDVEEDVEVEDDNVDTSTSTDMSMDDILSLFD